MLWQIDPQASSSLREQIIGCVRRGVISGELTVGDQLPPAVALAGALDVDRNTVLAAYRQLRTDGVLEFRRGRGVRVARATLPPAAVLTAAAQLIELGRTHGLQRDDLARLIQELS